METLNETAKDTISIRIPRKLIGEIREMALTERRTISSMFQYLVEQAIKERESTKVA